MFDLLKIHTVVAHLKKISTRFDPRGGEVIIYCPYCGDAERKANPEHGHCYLSLTAPVFNCFRCDTSGTLIRLLLETGFDDQETIEYLSTFIKYKFIKDFYVRKRKITQEEKINFQKYILEANQKYHEEYPDFYQTYIQYIQKRIGNIDPTKFLIIPNYMYNKLCCSFFNLEKELIVSRYIDSADNFRFQINKKSSGNYYFQEKNFDRYRRIVIAEGQFDIINLYLYSAEFQDSFFISIRGKSYLKLLEKLVFEELLIGKYEINFVFDPEVYYRKFLYRGRMFLKQYNNDIKLRGWMPLIQSGDVSDFPAIVEVNK